MSKTKPSRSVNKEPATANQVADYLREHTDFFTNQRDILESLTVPHHSGAAVSLVAKQLELFRNKNQRLEEKLGELLAIARKNEKLLGLMHKFALSLFSESTFEKTVSNLQEVLHKEFLADFVALRLIGLAIGNQDPDLFVPSSDKNLPLFQSCLDSGKPLCGQIEQAHATFFFGDKADEVKSIAIVPLSFSNHSGLLAIGSRDNAHFQKDMGHLFLAQMGELVSLRLSAFSDIDG